MINKVFKFTIGLFLFLLPLYLFPFDFAQGKPLGNLGIEYDKQVLIVFSSLIIFLLLLRKILLEKIVKIVATPFTFPLLFLAAFYVTSTVIASPNKIDSFISPFGSMTMIAAAILYLVLTQTFVSLNPLILSSTLVSLVYLLAFLPFSPFNLRSLFLNLSPLGSPLSAVIFLLPVAVYLGAKIALHFTDKGTRVLSVKLIKPFILPSFAFLFIVSTLATLGFHLLTDQKPLLLPFSFAWTIMMETAKSFPKFLFGVGPANFLSAYSIGKPIAINLTPFWNVLLTTSSNLPFMIVSEAGIIAAAIYLYIVIKIILLSSKVGEAHHHNISQSYLLALITATVLQLLFPPNITLFILSIILLACVSPKQEKKFSLQVSPVYLLFPVGLIILVGIILGGKFYLADIFYRRSLASVNQQKFADSYNLSQEAIKFNPSSDRYLLLSSALSLSIARNLTQTPNATSSAIQQNIVQLTQQAVTHARTATLLNRQNPRNWAQLAEVYQTLIGSVEGADQSALDALSQQVALEPVSPQPRLSAANIFASVGQLDQAQSFLSQAINLKPDWVTPHYNLASLYAQGKLYPQAADQLQKVLDLTPADSENYKKIEEQLDQIKQLIPKESTPAATPSSNLKKPAKLSPSPQL